MVDPAHSEPKATKVYNHVPENSHAIDGAILQNSSNKKAAFNRRLDVCDTSLIFFFCKFVPEAIF